MSEENKPSIGAGDVEIKLGDKTWVLKPSFRAAKVLSRRTNGFMGSVQAIAQLDIDAAIDVIKIGVGFTDNGMEKEQIGELVYSTGVAKLAAPLIRFVHILANGGRPPSDTVDEGDPDKRPLE